MMKKDVIVKYTQYLKSVRLPFLVYAELESSLSYPQQDHNAAGCYSMCTMCTFDDKVHELGGQNGSGEVTRLHMVFWLVLWL